jgi:DNA polymerase III epsilon subunit-like protein
VEFTSTKLWDLNSINVRLSRSIVAKEADIMLTNYLQQGFKYKPIAVAHNSEFDSKYMQKYLPNTFAQYRHPWICTVQWSRRWREARGIKGRCNLGEMCKVAGFVQEGAHAPLEDCRSCLKVFNFLTREQIREPWVK